MPAKVLRQLQEHAAQVFADADAWPRHLEALAIASSHRQTVTEAALLGSAVEHGVPEACVSGPTCATGCYRTKLR